VCGSKGTQTSSTTYTPPPQVTANYNTLTNLALQNAATPFTPYTGEMVAGLTPTQQAGISNINAATAEAQPYYQAGAGLVANASMPFSQQNLNQYMSPYISNVANTTLANLNETNAQQQQQLLGNTIQQGAFGGDRGGIAQAELARQQNLATGQTLANIYQGGYGQALGELNTQQQLGLAAGQELGALGAGAQSAALQGGQSQMSAGATQQAVQQAQDTAAQQQFQAQQAYPFQQEQLLANILLGVGGQSGGTALTSQPVGNIGSSLIGGLLAAGQVFPMSDERVKENIEPVGKTFDGQNIYKYNYKGTPTTQLGLIAQEVEHHHPSAVHKTAEGIRTVDYDAATAPAAERGHFAYGGMPDWMGGGVKGHESGRPHFALTGGVEAQYGYDIPYTDQPTGGAAKALTLGDVMRIKSLGRSPSGRTNIPQSTPKIDDSSIDPTKILQNAVTNPTAKSNLQSWVNGLNPFKVGTAPLNNPSDYIMPTNAPSPTQTANAWAGQEFASGGLVGRKGYAGDDGSTGGVAPYADPEALATSLGQQYQQLNAAPDPNKPRTLAEMLVGHPLSDEANLGVLAAGLGMLGGKSQVFGINVGEGAEQGLGTYYNALKAKRDFQNQLLQRQEEAQRNYISGQQIPISQEEAAAQMLRAKADVVTTTTNALASIRGLYHLDADRKVVVGPNDEVLTLDQYRNSVAANLKAITNNLITDDQINRLTDPSLLPRISSTPAPKALGGPATGKDQASSSDSTDDAQPVKVAQAAPSTVTDVPADSGSDKKNPSAALDYDALAQQALDRYNFARQHPSFSNSEDIQKKAMEDFKTFSALSPTISAQAREIAAKDEFAKQDAQNRANQVKAFSDDTSKFFSTEGYDQNMQLLDTLNNIYQKVESNRLSDLRADIAGYMKSFGIQKFAGMDLDQIQSANDTAIKAATTEAMQEVQSQLNRAPASGLRVAQKTVAMPNLAPGTRYQLLQNSYAELEQEKDARLAWLNAGKPEPDAFMANWKMQKGNDLPTYRQKIADTKMKEMFPGMNMEDILNKPKSVLDDQQTTSGATPTFYYGNGQLVKPLVKRNDR
jgi:Chaperone of endosialidase